MSLRPSLFFDAKDYEILRLVNAYMERRGTMPFDEKQHIYRASLHPHGIKELATSKEVRTAEAVIDLLSSLEAGQTTDRTNALKTLHDEVLYSESSSFRHNTGRVLIQIMKGLIRAKGNPQKQLRLAHDFRITATGRRRIVRDMLRRYQLLEMPEEWDHMAFDNHVHDSNTKGRKTPTHLIMDAWIKGIRKLNVVYYNYVESSAVEELLIAANIMDIEVNVGVEFQVHFRERYVQFVWEPTGFSSHEDFMDFLQEGAPQTLMEMGRLASLYHQEYIIKLLNRYNDTHRYEIGNSFDVLLPAITEEEIHAIVGLGQTSKTHLAELIFRHLCDKFRERLPELRERYLEGSTEEREALDALADQMNSLTADAIADEWLSYAKNPDIPLPRYTDDLVNVPEIMRFLPATLMGWLTSIRPNCNIILNINSLSVEDVLELLYTCEGMISHIELFNLKNYTTGKMPSMPEISHLVTAINEGSSIALKRLIRTIINEYNCDELPEKAARCRLFSDILCDITGLQGLYSKTPLKTRIGSDSTSRSEKIHGMGFVFPESLPARTRKEMKAHPDQNQPIPLEQKVMLQMTYYPRRYPKLGPALTNLIQKIPGCKFFDKEKRTAWITDPRSAQVSEKGNITTLGGFEQEKSTEFNMLPPNGARKTFGIKYMNTTIKNILKVLFGFALTVGTFQITQDWWFLAWFGPFIWFGITGFRNIVQSTLAGGGLRSTPLLRWNDYLSWTRLCDSLLYTGISVPLLELGVRYFLLQQLFQITPTSHPLTVFGVISIVNGVYIAGHNLYRGFPMEAVIGNIFRSILAVPISLVYSAGIHECFIFMGWNILFFQQSAAVISKMASDTVAAVIEGFADKVEYLRIRQWDYNAKLHQLFDTFSKLEVILPDEDILEHIKSSGNYKTIVSREENKRIDALESTIIICALDFLYFWMYLPRGRNSCIEHLNKLTTDETTIFMYCQASLLNVQRVSQLFVNGLVGSTFPPALSFYLAKYDEYLHDMEKLTGIRVREEDPLTNLGI